MVSEKRRKYIKRYLKENKERLNTYSRAYYHKNKDTVPSLIKRRKGGKAIVGDSDTCAVGRKFELLALKLLEGSHDANHDNFQGGYDILWNGKRVEVKMRNLNKRNVWNFTFKAGCTADLALLFCVGEGIQKAFLIPYNKQSSIAIGNGPLKRGSKYDKYQIDIKPLRGTNTKKERR